MIEQTDSNFSDSAEKLWLEIVDELTPGEQSDNAKRFVAGGYRRRAFSLFRDPITVAGQVGAGIPIGALNRAIDRGLIKQDEVRYVLPERTYRGRRQRNEPLSRDESDKFARLLQAVELAAETFGSTEKAHKWLRQPKRRFGGRTPISMLDTSQGAIAVEDMLTQIAHGIAA